jgi:putative transposase
MHVHLDFVSKYRRCVFTKIHLEAIKLIFRKICNDYEAELVEFDGEEGHVHLLVNYPPKVSISKLVNSLKGVSSCEGLQKCFSCSQKIALIKDHNYVAKLASFLPLTIFILEFVFFYHNTDIQELLLSMVLISTMFIFINKK